MARPRIRYRDFPLGAARRAVRAAILAPAAFAVTYLVLHDPTAALFATFGSTTLLLYVDFGGPVRPRLQSQLGLVLGTTVLLCIGSVAQLNIWTATATALVVTFAILFLGIVSSVLANAQTALLISFLLPLTLPGPLSALPDRLFGWVLASVGSLIAITVIWRGPTNDPLRAAAVATMKALGERARALAGNTKDLPLDDSGRAVVMPEVAALKRSFLATPFRPSGLGAAGRELAKLVEQQLQLDQALREITTDAPEFSAQPAAVMQSAADLLGECAQALEASRPTLDGVEKSRRALAKCRMAMEDEAIASTADVRRSSADSGRDALESVVLPSFDAQEVAEIVDGVAERTLLSARARGRTWFGHLLGVRSELIGPTISTARVRLGSHFDLRSVWLHNAVRGAVGFALTVFLANAIGVQHAFWVAFGTLAVLRSNAASTGQNALKAILGTLVGIVIGGILLVLIGHDTLACWILLPILVAITGLAPAFSFMAGQASFSVLLIVLFNLISPIGWTIGILRIEDVALGCAVSVVVSFLLWPRGAGAAFAVALSGAFDASASYLEASTEYALQRCAGAADAARASADNQLRLAVAAARRLDDSFRQLLTERGAKLVTFDELACMVNAVGVVRRTGDEIRALWRRDDRPMPVSEVAREQLRAQSAVLVGRYRQIAGALTGRGSVPPDATEDEQNPRSVVDAIWSEASAKGGAETADTLRLLWTLDYLQSLLYLDRKLLPAASRAADAAASPAAWLIGIRRLRRARDATAFAP